MHLPVQAPACIPASLAAHHRHDQRRMRAPWRRLTNWPDSTARIRPLLRGAADWDSSIVRQGLRPCTTSVFRILALPPTHQCPDRQSTQPTCRSTTPELLCSSSRMIRKPHVSLSPVRGNHELHNVPSTRESSGTTFANTSCGAFNRPPDSTANSCGAGRCLLGSNFMRNRSVRGCSTYL